MSTSVHLCHAENCFTPPIRAHERSSQHRYIFVVVKLKTRQIVHVGVTKYPTDEWTAQQLREATPWGKDRNI